MSNRAMSRMYSQGGGGGGNIDSNNELDLFGLLQKRKLGTAQGLSDIQLKYQKELENLDNQHDKEMEQLKGDIAAKAAKNAAIVTSATHAGIPTYDENGEPTEAFKNFVMPGGAASTNVAGLQTMAQGELARQGAIKDYMQSDKGQADVKFGQAGVETKPAFEASALSNKIIPPGGTMAFNPANNLTGTPSVGYGSMLTTTRNEPKMIVSGPNAGQYAPFPVETQTETPGRIPIAHLNLDTPGTGLGTTPNDNQEYDETGANDNAKEIGLQGTPPPPNPLQTNQQSPGAIQIIQLLKTLFGTPPNNSFLNK